jgi:TatD DNase family protein
LLPDTHAHLDSAAFDGDRDDVVQRALDAGVDRILAVGSDLESSKKSIEIASRYEPVYAAVGIHPHEAQTFKQDADRLRALLSHPKVVAVGEIGLDYYRSTASRENQQKAFRQQLGWARTEGLPVSVHNRAADSDVLTLLIEAQVAGILHCFSGTWEFGRTAIDAGMVISFAGNLTFPKADTLREVAGNVPIDRVLLETDSPVLAPQTWRGRRNEPAYVVATLATLAAAQDKPPDLVSEAISSTADRLFAWRTP